MADIKHWDEIDEQMAREAEALSRSYRSIHNRRKPRQSKESLKAGQARIFGASGAGEDRKSLGQILQGCR